MRSILVSDNPKEVWLSPERVAAARGLLKWTQLDLSQKSGVQLERLQGFEEYGDVLSVSEIGALKSALLPKVEFTITEGEPGVCRKAHVGAALGPGRLVFGGARERRPKL